MWPVLFFSYIYIYIYIYIYEVSKDCYYPKNEWLMPGYLILKIPVDENLYFLFKNIKKKNKKSENTFISLFKIHLVSFNKRNKFIMEFYL